MFKQFFQDSHGIPSFTRLMGAVIIGWSLLNYTIMIICKEALPGWNEASPLVTLVGIALTGKTVQKHFEKEPPNVQKT